MRQLGFSFEFETHARRATRDLLTLSQNSEELIMSALGMRNAGQVQPLRVPCSPQAKMKFPKEDAKLPARGRPIRTGRLPRLCREPLPPCARRVMMLVSRHIALRAPICGMPVFVVVVSLSRPPPTCFLVHLKPGDLHVNNQGEVPLELLFGGVGREVYSVEAGVGPWVEEVG